MNFDANFKDMLGLRERQCAASQRRLISITWRDWNVERRVTAGKGVPLEPALHLATGLWPGSRGAPSDNQIRGWCFAASSRGSAAPTRRWHVPIDV